MGRCVQSRDLMLLLVVASCALGKGLAWGDGPLSSAPPREAATLVQVNSRPVTQSHLETAYLVRGVSLDRQPALRKPLLERLVDETLIASFLERRRIKPNRTSLDQQVERIMAFIRRRGEDPDELLKKLGLDRQQIRAQLSLPLAWETYARAAITATQLRTYYEAHRRELDGTQLRARHIVLKVPPTAPVSEWERATNRLESVRREIQSGDRSFADAAREHSEGPSGMLGGDVGFFAYRGTMSAAFADAAFQLERGELSRPARTNVGVHLIQVTEERPGQLSLEDVRQTVLKRLTAQMWDDQVTQLRHQANIVWK